MINIVSTSPIVCPVLNIATVLLYKSSTALHSKIFEGMDAPLRLWEKPVHIVVGICARTEIMYCDPSIHSSKWQIMTPWHEVPPGMCCHSKHFPRLHLTKATFYVVIYDWHWQYPILVLTYSPNSNFQIYAPCPFLIFEALPRCYRSSRLEPWVPLHRASR